MSKQDKEQDGVLLKERIARFLYEKHWGGSLAVWTFEKAEKDDDCAFAKEADQILAKAREAVESLNSIDYPYGANYKVAILKALKGE